jgi:hypothetical protein
MGQAYLAASAAEAGEAAGSLCRLARYPAKKKPAASKSARINFAGVLISSQKKCCASELALLKQKGRIDMNAGSYPFALFYR